MSKAVPKPSLRGGCTGLTPSYKNYKFIIMVGGDLAAWQIVGRWLEGGRHVSASGRKVVSRGVVGAGG